MLSKMDIRAIRECDRLWINYTALDGAVVTCIKRLSKRGPFDPKDTRYEFTPDCVTLRNYGHKGDGLSFPEVGYASASNYEESDVATIGHVAREGDEFRVEFIAGNNSDNMTAAGVIQDICRIVLKRGDKRFRFTLDTYIGPDHSTARLCSRFSEDAPSTWYPRPAVASAVA